MLRAELGNRAEKVAEATIFAKTLDDAEKAGNKELAEQIRTQMKELGVEEVPFKPLSEGDRSALYTKIDDYHQQLEAAIQSGDKAIQKSMVEKIGDTQGFINATEGGGYFSGGATRQIVTLAEGLLKGAEKPLDAQVYTALLDQLPKLNEEASALSKGGRGCRRGRGRRHQGHRQVRQSFPATHDKHGCSRSPTKASGRASRSDFEDSAQPSQGRDPDDDAHVAARDRGQGGGGGGQCENLGARSGPSRRRS